MAIQHATHRDRPEGGELRKIAKHTLIYAAGTAISRLAGFIMLPIYTRYLTPADYGVLELLSMTIDIVGMLTGLSIATSVFRFHARYETEAERNEVVSTGCIGVTGLAALAAVLGVLASGILSSVVFGDGAPPLYFRIFFLIHLFQAAEAVPLAHIRLLRRSVLFVTWNVAKLVGMLSLNIFLVVGQGMDVLGVLLSSLIVSGLSATGLLILLFRDVPARFSPAKLKAMAKYAYPLAFVNMGNFILVFSDRYFVNHYAGTAAVGVYSLAYKFSFVLSALVFMPFQQMWSAERFVIAKRPDAKEIYARVFLYLNLALGGAAFLIALFARDVLAVMADPAFFPAHRVVPVLVAAQVIHHWSAYTTLGLYLNYKTGQSATASWVGVAVILLLNLLLIPPYGVAGAAAATLIGYGVRFLVLHELAQRQYRIDYRWLGIGRLYAPFVLAVAVRIALGDLELATSIAVGTVLALAAGGVALLQVVGPRERAFIRAALLRRRGLSTGAAR